MTITGHKLVGLAVGVGAAGAMKIWHPAFELWWLAVMLPLAVTGAAFPDRIEWGPFGDRWVTHRTWTHWWPFWLGPTVILLWPEFRDFSGWFSHPAIFAGMLAFFAGGLSHLLTDLPNPSGVPFLTPYHHVSLGLWKSGQMEWAVVPLAFLSTAPLWWVELQSGSRLVLSWGQSLGLA